MQTADPTTVALLILTNTLSLFIAAAGLIGWFRSTRVLRERRRNYAAVARVVSASGGNNFNWSYRGVDSASRQTELN